MNKQLMKALTIGVSTVLLAGCATTMKQKVNLYKKQSPQVIYQSGMAFLQKNDYTDAITALETLSSEYPFNDYAKKGNIALIYAYFQDQDQALALALAERYIKRYPADSSSAYAYYMTGLIDFDDGRGLLQRRLPYKMSSHDTASYRAAYHNFNTLINQYPKSQYAQDAKRRMVFLNQVMADHTLHIAKFYFERKAYVAAANRALHVVKHFPNTNAVKTALFVMLQSYRALDLPTLTQKTLQLLGANYPHSQLLAKIKAQSASHNLLDNVKQK